MLGRLQDLWLSHELQAQVKHRLPGRLRLHLTALKRLSPYNGDVTGFIEDYLTLPEGVEGVSVDTRIGSLLIRYQPEVLAEEDVLNHVTSLSTRVRDAWPQIKHLDPQRDTQKIVRILQSPGKTE